MGSWEVLLYILQIDKMLNVRVGVLVVFGVLKSIFTCSFARVFS